MARPVDDGLQYFPFDVDFFSDRKIKIIRAQYGADGILLYVFVLCEIYRDKGYYTQVDNDFNYLLSDELNMSSEKIGQMMNFLLGRSLFNDTLFRSDKVLTSTGIQRRYQEAVKARALKNPRVVNAKFWLLSSEETQSFIKVQPIADNSMNNADYSTNNSFNSENNDTKKRKENKSKENKNNARDISKVYALFNENCSHIETIDTGSANASRERKTSYLLNQYVIDTIESVFKKAGNSSFLASSSWCNYDWIVKQENFMKIEKGNYDNRVNTKGTQLSSDSSYDLEELDKFWDKIPVLKKTGEQT